MGDGAAFHARVEWHSQPGTDGLVPCGTTGESPPLTHAEHMRVTELCIEVARGKVPVVAGTGSNSTEEAIQLTCHAKKAGADAALVVTPYYNKPTQEGLYLHYKAIHDAAGMPILIYNIPGRSIVDMSVETMAQLAKLPNVIGVKDATSDLARPIETRMAIGPGFCQMSGEDATVVPFLAAGGHGCISVTANIAPRMCADLHKAWRERDLDTVMRLQDTLMAVHLAMFCETSPAPVKYAAALLGKCLPEVRLPMCEIEDPSKAQVKAALTGAGLL